MINIADKISNNKNVSFGAKHIPIRHLKAMERRILNAKTIDVYSHSSPDEDTINSSKVMYDWFKKLGKDVSLCFNAKETDGLLFKKSRHFKMKEDLTKTPDLAFFVDFNSTERISKRYINSFKAKDIIGLDHHDITPTTMLDSTAYIDNKAHSCSGVVYRFFEGLKIKLKKADLESLYCGMLSDYKKSKLVSISNTADGHKLNKFPELYKDKYSNEVLSKIESQLSPKSKEKILKHLDTLSSLSVKEKGFLTKITSEIKVTKNGDLAYIVIEPGDKQWKSIGMDNTRTSEMLSDLRSRIVHNAQADPSFSPELKSKLANVKGAIFFYRASDTVDSSYKMSIHSKGDYAKRLIDTVRNDINPQLVAGGHPDRAGGKIRCYDKAEVDKFVNNFLLAAESMK